MAVERLMEKRNHAPFVVLQGISGVVADEEEIENRSDTGNCRGKGSVVSSEPRDGLLSISGAPR
jgi:hypothetical protein